MDWQIIRNFRPGISSRQIWANFQKLRGIEEERVLREEPGGMRRNGSPVSLTF